MYIPEFTVSEKKMVITVVTTECHTRLLKSCNVTSCVRNGVPKGGGFGVFKPPPPEIPKF
jgi:hypothetical protein